MNKTCTAVAFVVVFAIRSTGIAASSPQFRTIYEFGALNNIPGSELTVGPAGQLFGTTYGGAYSDGAGSVYELTPGGSGAFTFKELYRFDSAYSPPNDGQNPYAGLTLSPDGKTLYGSTQNGGSNSDGIQFSLDISKAEGNALIKPKFGMNNSFNVIHSFTDNEGNGAHSTYSDVEDFIDGALFLFGTVLNGGYSGDYGSLTVLEIAPEDQDSIIVVIPFDPTMGTRPQGQVQIGPSSLLGSVQSQAQPRASGFSLTNYNLYGIAGSGGTNNAGTLYRVRADGSNFVVLHAFAFAATNGALPQGGLVLSGNTLYGTTSSGGSNFSGTLFQIQTDGTGFKILVNFNGSVTGSSPQGNLLLAGDTLYGTTYIAGTNGGGTVYSVKTNGGNFTVLHSFNSPADDGNGHYTNSDGGWSVTGLALAKNILYGITSYGGTNGVGTAYEIVLPGPPSLNIAPSGNSTKISWPSSATNYVLQSNSTLNSLTWSNSTGYSDDGTNRSILVTKSGSAFFRLLSTNGP